eukprot:TRINITY_DN111478_c0_g1_i1.p1 TRINITY_DN111478_c0_g1~~TRINITY_DN111478_c0_g1_i1.p1  ORF type:complete len:397 (-),score=107.63 TRINITY_DN111478_c0_g1_i1:112-1302(-)
MSVASLIEHYNVPSSRVVGVTPMLGRPLSLKKRPTLDESPESSQQLQSSSSLPALRSIGSRAGSTAVARELSIDELRLIALCGPAPILRGNRGRPARPRQEQEAISLPAPTPPKAGGERAAYKAKSAHSTSSSASWSPAENGKAKAAKEQKKAKHNAAVAKKEELKEPLEADLEEVFSDEEDPYERSSGERFRKTWSPDSGPKGSADAGTALAAQGKKKEPMGNPFAGADESGRRLQWERKWLVENPEHLEMRRRQFTTDGRLTTLATKQMDPDLAYEMKVYHGAYSMQVKANADARAEKRRIREGGNADIVAKRPVSAMAKADQSQAPQATTRKGRGNQEQACVRMLRQLQKELKESDPDGKPQPSTKESQRKKKHEDEGGSHGPPMSSRVASKN